MKNEWLTLTLNLTVTLSPCHQNDILSLKMPSNLWGPGFWAPQVVNFQFLVPTKIWIHEYTLIHTYPYWELCSVDEADSNVCCPWAQAWVLSAILSQPQHQHKTDWPLSLTATHRGGHHIHVYSSYSPYQPKYERREKLSQTAGWYFFASPFLEAGIWATADDAINHRGGRTNICFCSQAQFV